MKREDLERKEDSFPLLDENNITCWILIQDIMYFNKIEEISNAITKKGTLRHFICIPEAYHFLKNYGFELLGKSLLVNIDQISYYDSKENILYFDKELHEKSAKLYVTIRAINFVKNTIGLEYDIADKKKSSVYSPLFSRKGFNLN